MSPMGSEECITEGFTVNSGGTVEFSYLEIYDTKS